MSSFDIDVANRGNPGATTYERAQALFGFTGTEEEYMASLRGADADTTELQAAVTAASGSAGAAAADRAAIEPLAAQVDSDAQAVETARQLVAADLSSTQSLASAAGGAAEQAAAEREAAQAAALTFGATPYRTVANMVAVAGTADSKAYVWGDPNGESLNGLYFWNTVLATPAWQKDALDTFTKLGAKADLSVVTPRAFLRPQSAYLAAVVVDRSAATVSFPPMVIIRPGGSAISVSSLDTITVQPLSTALATFIYYYVDTADATLKNSTNSQYSVSSAGWIAIGYSSNGAFQSAHGHRVRYVTDEAPNIRVWTHPSTAQGKGTEAVIVDRIAQTVRFPRLSVWRANVPGFANVNPVGWPATGYTSFPLSADFDTPVWYYADLAAGTLGSTTVWNSPAQSNSLIYIGSSIMGGFSPLFGLRVEYPQVDTPSLGIISSEGLARQAQAGWQQTQYASRNTYVYTGAKVHPVQPAFPRDIMRVAANTGMLDLTHFPPGTALIVRSFATPVAFYAGRGRTFLGGTSNRCTLPAFSACEVISSFGDIMVSSVVGALTYDTTTEPVRDISIALAGQSQRVLYGQFGGIGGFQRALRDAAWIGGAAIDVSINWIPGAEGDTAIDRRSVAGASVKYWWDVDANGGAGGPGPVLNTFMAAVAAAVAAGQPAPTWAFWDLGQTDATALEAGTLTVAQMTSTLLTVWDYIRANGSPDCQFLVSTVGSNEFGATRGMTGSRTATLDAIAAREYAHHGADYYDMPRLFGNVHLADIGYAAWGHREAKAWVNLAYGRATNLGPTATGATLSANGKIATIAFSRTGPLFAPPGQMRAGEVNGPYPFGIGIIPAGQPTTVTPIAAVRGYMVGAALAIEADVSLAGCKLVYPYGLFPEQRNGQFMRDYQADLYHGIPGLPMRAFQIQL